MNSAVASLSMVIDDTPARPRVNWFTVIVDLENSGVTIREQAAHCSVAAGTICYWKAGGEPRHMDGQHLISLYALKFPGRSTPMQMFKNLNGIRP